MILSKDNVETGRKLSLHLYKYVIIIKVLSGCGPGKIRLFTTDRHQV
jgi:hypothetical protein